MDERYPVRNPRDGTAAPVHRIGTEVLGRAGLPGTNVPWSWDGFSRNVPGTRHSSDPREAREGRTARIRAIHLNCARSAHVKPSLKSRLFGIAVTLSLFAAFVSPMLGKRW